MLGVQRQVLDTDNDLLADIDGLHDDASEPIQSSKGFFDLGGQSVSILEPDGVDLRLASHVLGVEFHDGLLSRVLRAKQHHWG